MADKCGCVDKSVELDDQIKVREVAEGKAAEEKATDVDSSKVNSVSQTNYVVVPDNCLPGQQRGEDGVCRDVF